MPPAPTNEARARRDLDRILRAALTAVDPEGLVARALGDGGPLDEYLRVLLDDATRSAASDSVRLRLVSVGKAAVSMARGALRALGPDVEVEGIVLAPAGWTPSPPDFASGIRYREGGHPLPTADGTRATREILSLVREGGASDPIIFLLSGGGSALLSHPEPGLTLEDLRTATEVLLRAGASIEELNTIRKHLESAKGGRLAHAAAPSPVLALVISDVIGNPLDVIASGPLSPDRSTFVEAVETLERLDLRERIPPRVLRHLEKGARGGIVETPKGADSAMAGARVEVIGHVGIAAEAATAAARREGYRSHVLTLGLSGEAREVGRVLAGLSSSVGRGGRSPVCLVCGGETTVTVRGHGRGGPNQELVLAAARALDGEEGVLLASFGTDGIDGPTDAAGAVATGTTVRRAFGAGLDPDAALLGNDSHPFFRTLDDLLVTGPTGTNVMDLQVILIR